MFSSCHSTANVLYTSFFVLCAAWFVDWKWKSYEKKRQSGAKFGCTARRAEASGAEQWPPPLSAGNRGTRYTSVQLQHRRLCLSLVRCPHCPVCPRSVRLCCARLVCRKNLFASGCHFFPSQNSIQACGASIEQRGRMYRRLIHRRDRLTCARTRLAVAVAVTRTTDSCCCRPRTTLLLRLLHPPPPPLPLVLLRRRRRRSVRAAPVRVDGSTTGVHWHCNEHWLSSHSSNSHNRRHSVRNCTHL
jgi:hypothetical protein